MEELKYTKYEKDGHIVTITMNRPERLNAFGQELRGDLAMAWHRFIEDDDAWVAILTGAGRDIKAQAEGATRREQKKLSANFTVRFPSA